jgi:hypothetical protein
MGIIVVHVLQSFTKLLVVFYQYMSTEYKIENENDVKHFYSKED